MRRSFQGPSARATRAEFAARGYSRTARRCLPTPGWLLLGGLLLLAAGCTGGDPAIPPRVIPKLSPQDAAAAALAEYDANKDGAIDAKELNNSPPLKDAVAKG